MKRVLIADDSKTTQMLLRTTLNRLPNVEIQAADNGREALGIVEREPVDLLVTDINMPEMDGIELVRAVRKTRTREQLPILIITAKGEDQARNIGLAEGADAYILKPISGRDLLDLANRLLA